MVRLCIDVGRVHGLRPADVVATIAREADVPGTNIGAILIDKAQTLLDVHEGSVAQVLRRLKRGFMLRGQEARVQPWARVASRGPARGRTRR